MGMMEGRAASRNYETDMVKGNKDAWKSIGRPYYHPPQTTMNQSRAPTGSNKHGEKERGRTENHLTAMRRGGAASRPRSVYTW